jgi:protein transport protein SEC61 subunit gamma-like protein
MIKAWLSGQITQYIRLWRIMKKPSMEEFKIITKVSAIGILILGLVGFVINLVITLIK